MIKNLIKICLLTFLTNLLSCQSKPQIDNDLTIEFENCLVPTSAGTLEIVTWNLKQFPLSDGLTIKEFSRILTALDCDVVALQEITNINDFNNLLEELSGWDGQLFEQGDLNLGFIYKNTEIQPTAGLSTFYEDSTWAFPRTPVKISLKHMSGINVILINLHLKCCGGTENESRREKAGRLLKNYLDDIHPNDSVVILGDFNDEIYPSSSENVFQNFIDDSDNYAFADMNIASGSQVQWSYPFYPSHIDHILITNELFEMISSTETLIFDVCDNRYFDIISDHRPLIVSFEK